MLTTYNNLPERTSTHNVLDIVYHHNSVVDPCTTTKKTHSAQTPDSPILVMIFIGIYHGLPDLS